MTQKKKIIKTDGICVTKLETFKPKTLTYMYQLDHRGFHLQQNESFLFMKLSFEERKQKVI